MIEEILLGLGAKGKEVYLAISFLMLLGGMIIETGNIAYCSLSPLDPNIEVTPKHTFLGGEITLIVKVLVDAESNVSVSMLQVMGVGEASLLSEASYTTSVVADTGEIASLKWVYNATQVGNVYFSAKVTVTNLVDQNVVLSEELTSKEVGISRYPRTSLLGVAIASLFIVLISHFSSTKPKRSLSNMIGGFSGVFIVILCLIIGILIGYFVTSFWQTTEIQQMVVLGLFGLTLSTLGYYSCWASKPKSTFSKSHTPTMWTEISGVMFVILGLSGFLCVSEAFLGLVFIFVLGIIAVWIEYLEIKR